MSVAWWLVYILGSITMGAGSAIACLRIQSIRLRRRQARLVAKFTSREASQALQRANARSN